MIPFEVRYGTLLENGKYSQGNVKPDEWMHSVIQSPDQLKKGKIGMCYDTTIYSSSKNPNTKAYIISVNNYDFHSFAIEKVVDGYILHEYSFGRIKGIYKARAIKHLFDLEATSTLLWSCERRGQIRIYEFNAKDSKWYGMKTVEFTDLAIKDPSTKKIDYKFTGLTQLPKQIGI